MSKRPASDLGVEPPGAKHARVDGHDNEGNGPGVPPAAPGHRTKDAAIKVIEYKENEQPMRGLAKYYREHAGNNPMVEVIIPPECMVNTNKRVRSRQLWGDGIYTDDSDVVAVLMHMGFYAYSLTAPPPNMLEVHVLLKLLPPRDQYPSSHRNSLKSRCWYSRTQGCSYQVDKCLMVTKQSQKVYLEACLDSVPTPPPTFAPSFLDRQIGTRAATGAVRQRVQQELTVQYNLCNEPWLKYSMSIVADRGLKPLHWTSARLYREALYVETKSERYELAKVFPPGNGDAEAQEVYRWSKCKVLPLSAMRELGVPLPDDQLTVLHSDLAWEELKWGSTAVAVRGKEYRLMRIHFAPRAARQPQRQGTGRGAADAKAAADAAAAPEAPEDSQAHSQDDEGEHEPTSSDPYSVSPADYPEPTAPGPPR